MNIRQVRFVGGGNAGQTLTLNLQRTGATVRLPKHPDFAFCPECGPGEPNTLGEHWEEYEIGPIRFSDGHEHYYARPKGTTEVSVYNNMWFEYAKALQK